MRACEFLNESSSSGSTSAGNVATVAKPIGPIQRRDHFFGGDPQASIYSNNPMAKGKNPPKKRKKDLKS